MKKRGAALAVTRPASDVCVTLALMSFFSVAESAVSGEKTKTAHPRSQRLLYFISNTGKAPS